MDINLSTGAVATLMKEGHVDKPVFQILGFEKIAGQGGNYHFQLKISDGLHSQTFEMSATLLDSMIAAGELDNNCVARAEKLIFTAISEKRVLISLNLTVIKKGTEVDNRLGSPVQYSEQNANLAGGASTRNGSSASSVATPRALSAQRNMNLDFGFISAAAFHRQQKSATNQQTPAVAAPRSNASFGNTSTSDAATVPIRDITPNNNKCSIKARVINKSAVRTWSNSREDGKLFTMDLCDESGKIRMTGFSKAVDQFYDIIKVNEVYIISKFNAKLAKKHFTSLNHEYEISFINDTQVMLCLEQIPTLSFSFTEIAFIEGMEKDKIIDVIGVCKRRGDIQTITTKDGKELSKRDIFLVDQTNTEVALELWGKEAEDFEDDTNPVVAIKGAKVRDFNGKSISMLASSCMLSNPNMQESHQLRHWFDNQGIINLSHFGAGGNGQWKLLREAVNSTATESGYYFKSKVTVWRVKRDNVMYKACTEEKCNKKVTDMGNGLFRSEKCNKENHGFKWRMTLNVIFGDCSDAIWATCFQESGELLLGIKTEELGAIHQDDPDRFNAIISQAVFKSYTAKFRARMETYNNENRLEYSVVDIQTVNFAEYAQKLVAEIKETMG